MSESAEKRVLAASFRPAPGGFVYRAPSGWRFWTQPHFLVDADLRDRLIAASDEPAWVVALWLAVPWIVVILGGVTALASYFSGGPGHELEVFAGGLVIAVVGLAAGLAAMAEHKWRRVAPLLRGAERTQERISSREMMTAVRAAGGPSRRALFAQVVSGGVLMAAGVLNFGMAMADLDHTSRLVWPRLLSGAVMAIAGFAMLFVAGRNLANKKD